MLVRSTGLGRTLLTGRIAVIETTTMNPSTLEPSKPGEKEPMRMLMAMEITHPVHWTVRAFLDPPDLREMVMHIIKNPGLIIKGIIFLFSSGPKYDKPAAGHAGTVAAAPKSGPAAPPGPSKGPAPIPTRNQ